jgi:hypothetical protein
MYALLLAESPITFEDAPTTKVHLPEVSEEKEHVACVSLARERSSHLKLPDCYEEAAGKAQLGIEVERAQVDSRNSMILGVRTPDLFY